MSGKGLCYGPITRPEESYRLLCDRGKGSPRPGIESKRHRKIKPHTLYKASGMTE
jgi:hypothetical protein